MYNESFMQISYEFSLVAYERRGAENLYNLPCNVKKFTWYIQKYINISKYKSTGKV